MGLVPKNSAKLVSHHEVAHLEVSSVVCVRRDASEYEVIRVWVDIHRVKDETAGEDERVIRGTTRISAKRTG